MPLGTYVKIESAAKSRIWKDRKRVMGLLDMELTERCNNSCIHCCINLAADDSYSEKRELSKDEIKGILNEAVSLGFITVRFTGGEPLLREDFEEIYIFTRQLGLKVMIATNATLITPQLADLFSRIPPLKNIGVSVYGMKKHSYEAVTRCAGSFEKAWRGIDLLLEKNIPFTVRSAFLEPNKDEREEFEKWAATIPWMNGLPLYSSFFTLHLRRDTNKSNMIRKLRMTPQEGIEFIMSGKSLHKRAGDIFCSQCVGPRGNKLFNCSAGRNCGSVDAYGNFQLCIMLKHPDTVYDLKNGSLKDAMDNFFPKIRKMRITNPDYLSRCGRCFLKDFCSQCPAKSWAEHGSLDKPVEYICEITHEKARSYGLLDKHECAWDVENWKERVEAYLKKKEA
ncbi:radical SAM protein [Candidatus Omnitrophota bacterium]